MVVRLPPFPDIERVLMSLIDRDVDGMNEKSGTELPDGLDVPFARVARVGGRRNRLKDYPWVDIEVFATGTDGKSILEDIEAALFGYPGAVAVGERFVKIEDVQVRAALHRRPWEDDRVRRYAATYQLRVSRLGS
jgi:hypothetical protein